MVRLCIAILMALASSLTMADEKQDDLINLYESPSQRTWEAALKGLKSFKESRLYKDEIEITALPEEGLIHTNWFPEHKGEVTLKVVVNVWGNYFRVDSTQLTGIIFKNEEKTDWSDSTQRKIQILIEAKLGRTK